MLKSLYKKYCLLSLLFAFTMLACQTFGQLNDPVGTAIAGTVAVEQGVSGTLTTDATLLTPVTTSLDVSIETRTPLQHTIILTTDEQSLRSGEQSFWRVSLSNTKSVLLSIEARVDWPTTAGLAYLMDLSVNNSAITEGMLVNKSSTFTFADGRAYYYFDYISDYSTDFIPHWGVFYSPDYQTNNVQQGKTSVSSNTYTVMEGNAYLYVFDITSLLTKTETEIALTNEGGKYEETLSKSIVLFYRHLNLLVSQ